MFPRARMYPPVADMGLTWCGALKILDPRPDRYVDMFIVIVTNYINDLFGRIDVGR